MLMISGMVLAGQDPETRLGEVIQSATWIPEQDLFLVEQGKTDLLTKISNENWVAPYNWRITWENVPPQEPEQWVNTELQQNNGLM